jgi:hypothetical protein
MEFLASALASSFPSIYHHTQHQTTAERERGGGERGERKKCGDGGEEKMRNRSESWYLKLKGFAGNPST